VGKESSVALVARAEKNTIARESGFNLMDQLIYFFTSVPIELEHPSLLFMVEVMLPHYVHLFNGALKSTQIRLV
jgi:hypothetical protein